MEKYKKIASKFGIEMSDIKKVVSGNINQTFVITDTLGDKYTLQSINTYVFSDVDKLIENIVKVTEFQRDKIEKAGGDSSRECLRILPAGDKYYFKDEDGNFWRIYVHIEKAYTYQIVENPIHFLNAGLAFGNFQKMLSEFPAHELHETIPNFHNTRARFSAFTEAIEKDSVNRRGEVSNLLDFALGREEYAGRIVDKLEGGELQYKVTHNDTKFNNVLIDEKTGKGICVIDLDTIMAGSVLYDFGDAIRFGASTAKEDEADLNKVHLDLNLFEHFTKGYLGTLNGTICEKEKQELAFSAILMTYECGLRFLTDYLMGDKYFVTRYERQNYYRCRTQFKLVEEMEKNYGKMQNIVKKYS